MTPGKLVDNVWKKPTDESQDKGAAKIREQEKGTAAKKETILGDEVSNNQQSQKTKDEVPNNQQSQKTKGLSSGQASFNKGSEKKEDLSILDDEVSINGSSNDTNNTQSSQSKFSTDICDNTQNSNSTGLESTVKSSSLKYRKMKKTFDNLQRNVFKFLSENKHYDPIVCLTNAAESCRWDVVDKISSHHGLYLEKLALVTYPFFKNDEKDELKDILKKNIIAMKKEESELNGEDLQFCGSSNKCLDEKTFADFLDSLCDAGMRSCLVRKPRLAELHSELVLKMLHRMSPEQMNLLAKLYNPTDPEVAPLLRLVLTSLPSSISYQS